jgi:hypothetical protein
MAWANPKTNWGQSGQTVPGVDDFNRIEGNINYIEKESRTPNQADTPAASGVLGKILDFFATQIKKITGKTNWYDAPDTTLAAAKTHMDAANPHSGSASDSDLSNHTGNTSNPHSVTKSQVGLGNVPNYTAEQTRTASSYKLRAEVKSSAPSSPANGDIWYDSTEHKFKGRANGAWV